MSRSLILSFNSAVAKYSHLTRKVRKSISKGEFWRYTRRKRHHLLARIERLRRRILELRMQAKLAGAGIAAALLMMTGGDVSAQQATPPTALGPFVQNQKANPFPPTPFDRVPNPAVSFLDMDKDGDLDAALASPYGGNTSPYFYVNVGTKEVPSFEPTYVPGISWYEGAEQSRVAFADVDDDGDLDALVGVNRSGPWDYSENADELRFFRNNASSPSSLPVFQLDAEVNPFVNIRFKKQGWPAFTDYDNDGDLDLVVTGLYDDAKTGKTAWLQFFRNDKAGHDPGDVFYTPLQGPTDNPLYIGENSTAGFYAVSFADLDGDGDDDSFAVDQHGQMLYRRNDGNGVFVEQTNAFTYKPNGASTGNPLAIAGITLYTPDSFQSFSFGDLDGDGDTDLVIGTNNKGTVHSPYIYVENTGNGVMDANNSYSLLSGFSMGENASGRFFDYDKDGDNDFLGTGQIAEPYGAEGLTKDVVGHAFMKNNKGVFTLQEDAADPFAALTVDGTDGQWVTGDADGDGDIDGIFVTQQYSATELRYYLSIDYYMNDKGTFVIQKSPDNPFKPVVDLAYDGGQIDIGDINADGLPDMVIFGNGSVPVFFKNTGQVGSPSFVQEDTWTDGLMNTTSLNPKLVDLDGDGDTDMVLGKYYYVWYYENIGTPAAPKWAEYQDYDPNNPFGQIAVYTPRNIFPEVADVDGDGDKDFIVTKKGNFTYFENQNPAPLVIPGPVKNLELVINQPITIDNDVQIDDQDGDNIVKATLTISPYEPGLEKLQVPASSSYPNLTVLWDNQLGKLTISGSASLVDYVDALQDVQYVYTGVDGSSANGRKSFNGGRTIQKTIALTVLDADQTLAPTGTASYIIGRSNIAPVITPDAFNATYAATAIAVLPSIVLSDGDDTTLASAQVSFGSGSYKPAEDRLQMTLSGKVTASFDQVNGILTLTGAGTVAEYQAALQAVQYTNVLGAAATAGVRSLSVKVNDGEADSNLGTTQLTVNNTVPPVNTPPTITGTPTTPFYINGDLVINNTIVVADVDGTLTGATVNISAGLAPAEDVLIFADQNGITGSYSSSTGTLTLTGSSTVANYQAALRSVKYRNTAADPNTTDRGITFTVTDGNPPVSFTGAVISINKPPVIKTATKKQAASDGNVAFPVSALSDPDNNLDLATLQVTSKEGNVTVADGIINIDYSSRGNVKGSDVITISVCDTGGRCKTQTIDVELGAAAVIFTGMSPNGDGINDFFYIENLPLNTHVAIYDRWGDAIFETTEYDMTEPSKRFEGKNKNGTDVVAGSYFYKVRFPDDNGVKTGYIILNR